MSIRKQWSSGRGGRMEKEVYGLLQLVRLTVHRHGRMPMERPQYHRRHHTEYLGYRIASTFIRSSL